MNERLRWHFPLLTRGLATSTCPHCWLLPVPDYRLLESWGQEQGPRLTGWAGASQMLP